MANYLLKYKGTYRILPEYCVDTNDVPRMPDGSIDPSYDDLYIACRHGNKIYHYGGNTLVAYIPSIGRGRNIKREMDVKNIPYFNYRESDYEIEFHFKAKDIEPIAELLKVKTGGANISPFSKRNLPKLKKDEAIVIPQEILQRYKDISSKVEKNDLLIIHRFTNKFLADFVQKTIRKDSNNKKFSVRDDMRLMKLGRHIKEYIYVKGYFDEYCSYMDKAITDFYKDKEKAQ